MRTLQQLLNQLCPEGVIFRPLSDIVDYFQPGPFLVASTNYDPGFSTPVLTAGQTFVLGYTSEEHGIYPASAESPVVIFDDFTTAFKWVDFPFKAKSSAMKLLKSADDELADLRYIYFVMQTIRYKPTEHARQWIGTYSGFRIPIPPLAIQREIVRILDQFTELEAQLEAELETRRRQYSFYRDQLLTFSQAGDVRTVSMGEIGTFFGGLTGKTKADFVDGNARFVSYVNVFNNIAVDLERDDFVRVEPSERQRLVLRGDVIFTGSSETHDEVGMSSVVTKRVPESTYLNSFSIGYRLNDPELLDPEFAKYLFRSTELRQQIVKTASGVTRFNVSKARLAKVILPVPSREEQSRIAGILDHFEALVNNLADGLPAELAARRKQYEYYRDKLLTFEEA